MEAQNPEILNMPMLPMRGLVIFPGVTINFEAARPRSIRAIEHAVQNKVPLFMVSQKDPKSEELHEKDLFSYGTIAYVRQALNFGGIMRVTVEGTDRARLSRIWQEDPYARVEVERLAPVPYRADDPASVALLRQARDTFENYANASAPMITPDMMLNVMTEEDFGTLADFMTENAVQGSDERQRILETLDPRERLEAATVMVANEIEVLEASQQVQEQLQQQIDRNQKEYVLREQLRMLREELGEDSESSEMEEYRKKIAKLQLSEEDTQKLLTEVSRLEKMQQMSPEAGVVRTYLDTVLELPWNKFTRERINVEAARKVLDADHYGLERVKNRILEYVAVRQLAPQLKGQIICLVGPPGVGKTSVGKSIARALNRKYARLSLGGVRDEADIRGHRKTYVGAMPGRIMTALKQAGSKNALLLLDEVDKLGQDYHGDPASALLEVLDSEQNNAFRDHYIEIPFDLSDVLFVVTANTTSTIPRPLLDRMEVIELTSYTDEEKVMIARQHLLPKQLKAHGLRKTQLKIEDDVLRELIDGYTRESGVRNLERELAGLCRKTAMKLVENPEERKVTVLHDNLEALMGPRKFHPTVVSSCEVGVVNGLAWTEVGGELLEVEVSVVEGTGAIELTGNLGDVMKESAHAARTYIRSCARSLGIDPMFYKNRDIHIHFPEAAVPKDGPSAGITVTVAMISALTRIAVAPELAMTGEVTLRGRVLPIGGLREKTMAALRNGIKTVIIPKANEPDLAEIDPIVRAALTFIPADSMDTVLKHALVSQPVPLTETSEAHESQPVPQDAHSIPAGRTVTLTQ